MLRLVLLPVLLALMSVPAASAGLPNPCALLTNAEVAKVFGARIGNRTSNSYGLNRGCTWDGVPPSSFTSYHASLRIDVSRVARAEFEKQARKAKDAVPVRGVGEIAYSQYIAGEFLSVWQNGIWISVELSGGSSPLADAKTLARAALTRL
jgi:hypothetical protein